MVDLQEVFTAAYKGLRKQGWQKCRTPDGECMYRKGSRRCAIGWWIGDRYRPEMEGKGVLDTLRMMGLEPPMGDERNRLVALQNIHDVAETPTAMKEAMEDFARYHALEVPE